MNTKETSVESAQFALLSQAILNLDPGTLEGLSPEGGPRNAAAGMNEFIRMMILRAMSLLYAADDYTMELYSDDAAEVAECNPKIHNLIELFAWALIRLPRRMRRRGELALYLVDAGAVELPEKRTSWVTTDQLVRGATAIAEPRYDAIRDAPGPLNCSISFCALIGKILDIKPDALIRQYHDTPAAAARAFERDPEGQAVAGVSAMLTRILHHQRILTKLAGDDDILAFKMYIGDDDAGPDGADGANLAALLTAGCCVGGKRRVTFVG